MIRIAFLVETAAVVLGLPWCVSCVLMWGGCLERAPTARERAVIEALERCVQEKLSREYAEQYAMEQEFGFQI